jgi:hypothetical protein
VGASSVPWLALALLVGACDGTSHGTSDASFQFPDGASSSTRDAGAHDGARGRDAAVDASSDTNPPPRDAGGADALYYANCSTPCPASCSGTCSAGNCLETVVSHVVLENNAVAVDPRAIYWQGLGPDAAPLGYTLWRDALDAGDPSLLVSSADLPDAGFLLQGPVTGGIGGAFFATVGPTASGPGRLFGAWPGVGPRLLFAPDSGSFNGLAVNDASVYASLQSAPGGGSVLRIVDGGGAVSLSSQSLPPGTVAADLAVNGTSFAWLASGMGGFTIFTGPLTGDASSLLLVAQGADAGHPSLRLDPTYVYWISGEGLPDEMNARHTVYRVPITGGATEAFLEDDDIRSFAVDDTSFYWSTAHPTGITTQPFTYSEAKVSTATVGARPTLLACEEAGGIVVDNGFVYLGTATTVYRLPK